MKLKGDRMVWQRLRAFAVSRLLHVIVITLVVLVVGVKAAGVLRGTSREAASANQKDAKRDIRALRSRCDRAYRADDWVDLVSACQRLVKLSPDDEFGWVQLAYGLHQLEKWPDAIAGYMRCCEFDSTRPWALYQMASIHSRTGKARLAIDCLHESFEKGFRPRRSVLTDPDFRSLLGNTEFIKLAEKATPLTERSIPEQLNFLTGNWNVLDVNDNLLGTCEFDSSSDGYAWRGTYFGENGDSSTIMYYFDPSQESWCRVRIDRDGNVDTVHGVFHNDSGRRVYPRLGRITLMGERISVDGKRQACRVRLTPLGYDRFQETVDISGGDGELWETDWVATYARPTTLTSSR